MTVTASGSPGFPQLFDTLPLSSVRQAEQQDRFPMVGALDTLVTFFRSGQDRVRHPDYCRKCGVDCCQSCQSDLCRWYALVP